MAAPGYRERTFEARHMLFLHLSLALADYDGGYSYNNDCYVNFGCDSCVRCDDLSCEVEKEDAGYSLACRDQDTGNEEYSVWCNCGGVGDDDDDPTGDDDDAPGDDDDTSTDSDPEPVDKGGACGGCDATTANVAVFGMLAAASGSMLLQRRRERAS